MYIILLGNIQKYPDLINFSEEGF